MKWSLQFFLFFGIIASICAPEVFAQTPDCTWLIVIPHQQSLFCHDSSSPDPRVHACRNLEEACCVYDFEIINDSAKKIKNIDLCADDTCFTQPIPHCYETHFVNHICEFCGAYRINGSGNPFGTPWAEDPACRRLIAAIGSTLGDGTADSLCKANCLHIFDTVSASGGLAGGDTLRIRLGFTGDGVHSKCVTVCRTFGDGTKQCCTVVIAPCEGDGPLPRIRPKELGLRPGSTESPSGTPSLIPAHSGVAISSGPFGAK